MLIKDSTKVFDEVGREVSDGILSIKGTNSVSTRCAGLLYYRCVYLLKVCIYEIKNGRIFRLIKKKYKNQKYLSKKNECRCSPKYHLK